MGVGLVIDILTYCIHRDYTYRPYNGSLIIGGLFLFLISFVSSKKITELLEEQQEEKNKKPCLCCFWVLCLFCPRKLGLLESSRKTEIKKLTYNT